MSDLKHVCVPQANAVVFFFITNASVLIAGIALISRLKLLLIACYI